MTTRSTPQNDTDRTSCCEHSETMLESTETPPRLRHLRVVCVESSDRRWLQAYERCATQHGAYLQAKANRKDRLANLMRAARRFFRGVFDTNGHSAPRILAECMNGLNPSALEDAAVGTRLRALKKLRTGLPGRVDLDYDAVALENLETAREDAVVAIREEERARGAWRGAVVAKREAAEEFDRGYRALVGAARELGGPAWINPWFPTFTDSNGKSVVDDADEADEAQVEEEEMADPPIDDIDDIDGVEDTPSPEEVSATANTAV